MNRHFSLESSTKEIESRRCARCEAELVLVRVTQLAWGSIHRHSNAFAVKRFGLQPIRSSPMCSAGYWVNSDHQVESIWQ